MVKKLSCVSCGSLKHFPHTFTTAKLFKSYEKILLGGAKDEHFSCYHSSCQLGLIPFIFIGANAYQFMMKILTYILD